MAELAIFCFEANSRASKGPHSLKVVKWAQKVLAQIVQISERCGWFSVLKLLAELPLVNTALKLSNGAYKVSTQFMQISEHSSWFSVLKLLAELASYGPHSLKVVKWTKKCAQRLSAQFMPISERHNWFSSFVSSFKTENQLCCF